jgi:cyclophilin family peptidyl-prolyl cis-trans isomerase
MPIQKNKRRRKRYEPGSAYAGDVKPAGIFRVFGNVKLFFIVGAFIMVGGLAAGGLCRNSGSTSGSPGSSADFVKPDNSSTPGTPDAQPTFAIKQYTTAPALTIDPSKKYTATIKTADGDIQVELLASEVPQTVNNFVFLAKGGFYNGLTFHQVTAGFDAQAGDPSCLAKQAGTLCRGTGGPGYELAQEKPGGIQVGELGMANASQFFIALDSSDQFKTFTPFGRITSGLDIAQKLTQGTEIKSVEISEQ